MPRKFFLDGGMVLMYALAILVILAMVGLSLQQTGSSLLQTSEDSKYRRLAQHAADSGIRYGITFIRGVLDPIPQYNRPGGVDPGVGEGRTHTSTPPGMGGNFPPVHPCNVFWRLMPSANSDIELSGDRWVRGGPPLVMDLVRNPPTYLTRFSLQVRAINVRPQGMIGQGTLPLGALANVGVRWEDLVDQVNKEFCHSCTVPPPFSGPPPPSPATPSYYPLTPDPSTLTVTSQCFGPVMTSAPGAVAPTNTTACTFGSIQPYLLTCTGTVFLYDPTNPALPGYDPTRWDNPLMASAASTVVASQIIAVGCRVPTPISASSHSTYEVTAVNQER